jgi:hypothetical protein
VVTDSEKLIEAGNSPPRRPRRGASSPSGVSALSRPEGLSPVVDIYMYEVRCKRVPNTLYVPMLGTTAATRGKCLPFNRIRCFQKKTVAAASTRLQSGPFNRRTCRRAVAASRAGEVIVGSLSWSMDVHVDCMIGVLF